MVGVGVVGVGVVGVGVGVGVGPQPGTCVNDTPPTITFVTPESAIDWQYEFASGVAASVDEATTEPHCESVQLK